MDGGPFRVPRPTDRRVASRPEPTHRQQAEEPRSVNETPKSAHQAVTPRHAMREERSVKRFVLLLLSRLFSSSWVSLDGLRGQRHRRL